MNEVFRPHKATQVGEFITWAATEEMPLSIVGRNTKSAIGYSVRSGHTLDMSNISGITLYEPEELIIQAKAGTPIAEIESTLAEKNQILAFEPPDFGPLLDTAQGDGSIGGALACNLSGPRRFKVGAARDHFLGTLAYSGRGELFKAGGRVVKNVTGYDLCKVIAGSYGTLAVMTDVTVKVLPAPEIIRTVLISSFDDEGLNIMTQGILSALEISGAAHIPETLASSSSIDYVARSNGALTALRIEGPSQSVTDRCATLRKLFATYGETEELHTHNSKKFWNEIGSVHPFVGQPRVVWRISVPPQSGTQAGTLIHKEANLTCYYDWGGGLLWAAGQPNGDGGAAAIRNAVARAGGGHATLIKAPESLRSKVAIFQPQEPAVGALQARIKTAFDPKNILNRGRFTVNCR